ncbi:hypothetical protein MMC18_009642 [Xylographa bjoerkii]|nr:hypothetical protein [Xylographa bjoerkii]
MPLAESTRDKVSGCERRMQYTLSKDQKIIQKTAINFITGSNTDKEPELWKTHQYEYDKYGRLTANTIGWSVERGSSAMGSLSSATTKSGYGFKDGILVETITDPLGNAAVASYDMRMTSGPIFHTIKLMGQAEMFKIADNGDPIYPSPNPVRVNQLGQKEQYKYDRNGWLTKTISFDGTEINYKYDAADQAVKTALPTKTTQIDYIYINRKTRVTQDEKTIYYKYSLDGMLKSVIFKNGGKQVYNLDRLSRVAEDTNVFNKARQVTFDNKGRISSRSCRAGTYRFMYGVVNHTEGEIIRVNLDGARNYCRTFTYNGFGQVKRETVTAPDSTILLDTTYTLDGKQQLQAMLLEPKICPDLDIKRQYVYNGIGQLVQDRTQNSLVKYTYDGNSNIISVDTDGQTKHMTYNAIDQRADPGFEYDTNGRMVKDDAGQQYSFNDQDRLLSIQTSAGIGSVFSYHSDDSLAKHKSVEKTSSLYYNSQQDINAMRVTDAKGEGSTTSLFSSGGRLAAGYSSSGLPTYLLDQRGFTALILDGDQSTPRSSASAPLATATGQCSSSFQFQQEYRDHTSGVVYLRSRFYDPGQMAFVSMNSSLKENRYAYCSGDPINLVDPSGHSWTAYGVGMSAGIAVGIVMSLVVGPVAGAALSEGASAVIITAMVGGAVGNVAAGAVAANVDRLDYGLAEVGRDALVGLIGGLATSGTGVMITMAMSKNLQPGEFHARRHDIRNDGGRGCRDGVGGCYRAYTDRLDQCRGNRRGRAGPRWPYGDGSVPSTQGRCSVPEYLAVGAKGC